MWVVSFFLHSELVALKPTDHISALIKLLVLSGGSSADPSSIIKRLTSESCGVTHISDLLLLTNDDVADIGLSVVWRRRILNFIALHRSPASASAAASADAAASSSSSSASAAAAAAPATNAVASH
jgi:hypothetical protein